MGFKSMFIRKKKKKPSSSQSLTPAADPDSDSVEMIIPRSPSSTAESHLDQLRRVFKRFDVNSDGKISSSELGSMIASLGQTATEDEINQMIHEADKDGDGFIGLDEFIEINIKDVDSDEVLETLREAFSVFDIDGNGSICAEELHQVFKGLGEDCSEVECRRMISGVDSNGDGLITFDEFKVMMDNGFRFGLRIVPDPQLG